jgi:hypothetical protein
MILTEQAMDEKQRREILEKLSRGELSLMEATYELDLSDAGWTLAAMREAGLPMYQLPEHIVRQQAEDGREALRAALRTKPARRNDRRTKRDE